MSLTLAFESAIAGGSISLLDGDDEIDHWIGSSDISKAEDLLINIDTLLSNNNFSRRDIKLIAVSAGPGSFTGIRIGIATAQGLKSGLAISMMSIPALNSIAATAADEELIVAVPMGRNSICLQRFNENETTSEPYLLDADKLAMQIRADKQSRYIVHAKLTSPENHFPNVTNFGSNVARAIGLFAIKYPNSNVKPLFISKTA